MKNRGLSQEIRYHTKSVVLGYEESWPVAGNQLSWDIEKPWPVVGNQSSWDTENHDPSQEIPCTENRGLSQETDIPRNQLSWDLENVACHRKSVIWRCWEPWPVARITLSKGIQMTNRRIERIMASLGETGETLFHENLLEGYLGICFALHIAWTDICLTAHVHWSHKA